MRWLYFIFAFGFFVQNATAQESYVPERRIVVSQNVDFYGSDLQNLFDTTYDSCENACLSNSECAAFTFNTRSNACFPKSEITEQQPYDGATSAEVYSIKLDILESADRRAIDIQFVGNPDLLQAKELAQNIGKIHPSGPWNVEEMLQAALTQSNQGNAKAAIRWTGGALAKADSNDLWLEYARLNATIQNLSASETRSYRDRAYLAAINGYLRATGAAERVNALIAMSDALELQNRGRNALAALRLADGLQSRSDVTSRLDSAIAKYGFRVTEHTVESDLEAPRFCAEFNEDLIKAGQDYAPFVKLSDQKLAVNVEERRICIEGMAHGQRASITFRQGLPALSGETLIKDIELNAYIRDRNPRVSFAGRAYVLPRSSDAGLPIETVNLDHVELTLQRVNDRNLLRSIQDSYFGAPLSYWQIDDFSSDVAETVWQGTGELRNELNQTMTTRLPIGEAIIDQPPGVYALSADLPGADTYDETSVTQWFILSDLGVTSLSGVDGLHVFVRALSDASAQEDVTVTLLSRANRVLGTALTDTEGYVRFEAGLTRGSGGAAPALVTLQSGDDFSFLSLTDPAFDLSDRGVEGRPSAPPIDLFVSTDRGAYRAGETVFVTALARGALSQALPGLPVTAILTRPDGVEYTRKTSTAGLAGGHVFDFPIGSAAPRGSWKIAFKSDLEAAPLATSSFLVEDFLPERIDFDVTLPKDPLQIDVPTTMTVDARYLFGAPAAGLAVEGRVSLRARSDIDGFSGFRFGRHDEPFYGQTEYFGADDTDSEGRTLVDLFLPEQAAGGYPLEADIVVSVLEGSGRPVERRISYPVAPDGQLIGIKPAFEENVVPEGSRARFDIVALGRDLTPQPMAVQWTINRVRTTYQWYQLYGNWEWEPTTTRTRVASGQATLEGQPLQIEAPVEWGTYEVVVEQIDGTYVSSSLEFYAGWYAPVDASDTPDTLELSLDKQTYRSGETATLRLVPRYDGTALVSVVSNRLIAMKAVDVSEGENVISLDVTDEWGAGAYVTASVIRPSNAEAGRNPARALGLAHAGVDPGGKLLGVALDVPEKTSPRGVLEVGIDVSSVPEGETAYVTLAAVDVGILNLTSFTSPSPEDHYFGQRKLGMEIRDIYGRLIDGLNGEMGALRSGGDAGANTRFDSPPPTEELVAYFTGPITVDNAGQARASFELPDFNGSVRLMAIAWSASAIGQADTEVVVRDPVVVTASLPRFLAPGDMSRLLLEFVHTEGPAGRMGLDVSGSGFAIDATAIPSGFDLETGAKAKFTVPVTATNVGDHSVRIALTTPDGKQLIKTLTLPVRANDPEVSQTRQIELAAGDALTLDDDIFSNLRAGTGSAVVSSGAMAKFDVPGLLQALDRYPYGCTEQVTSQALPLLYFESVSNALGLAPRDQIETRISQAVSQVLTRQASNGAFGLWRAESGDFWLDAYVSDFLSRARARGHSVPDLAFRQAMDNLRNRINYAPDFDEGGEDIAYALLVLAREGAAAMGDLRYYADVKADAFSTPLAQAQIGAALAYYGDQTRADRMFHKAAQSVEFEWRAGDAPIWRADYGTRMRDAAAVVTLALDSGSAAIDTGEMVEKIHSYSAQNLSTQESVWSLLAANALIEEDTQNGLTVNGSPLEGPLLRALEEDIAGAPLVVRNEGSQPTQVTVTSIGVPDYHVSSGGYGYGLQRHYYAMDGTRVQADTVQSGDRFVVVLTVTPFQNSGARLMINDPLPAGFEIDNPNLLASGDIRELDWLEPAFAEHSEFRSERFLSALNVTSAQPVQLAYIVRAVSPGEFHHPAASVEDMYRPQYRGNTAASRLIVLD